ncbi:MAG: FAD-dependent oxidoreductase [Desulfobacteraceae bacterium]
MTEISSDALVVGGGISGIRSALDLAERGFSITLIEKEGYTGGMPAKLDHQFPTNGCGICRMLPMAERDSSEQFCLRRGLFHDRINVLLSTTLEELEGEAGGYKATLKRKNTFIDPGRCIGCGECARVCPVNALDEFNAGLCDRKAVFLPSPHAIPNTYVIDPDLCNLCSECVSVCPTSAITLPEDRKKEFSILVVDDELIVRDSLKEMFEFEGFSVSAAGSGQEALDLLEEGEFSLMLLDIKMPGMEGTEVLKRAKEKDTDLSVIMMTAYATVESAVETLKVGAHEYIVKPFDDEELIKMVYSVFNTMRTDDRETVELQTGAVILSCGTSYYTPDNEMDTFGWNTYPDVVTSIEFERILSGTGPFSGELKRPSDGGKPQKIAWLQCVGSRNLQTESEYCSSVCCMYALKEAMLVKNKFGSDIETTIYYMDMRCFVKDFERYRKDAEDCGVILKRARPHSVTLEQNGSLCVRISEASASLNEEHFDMVVLSVGQRPAFQTAELAEITGVELNEFGFPKDGIFENDGKKGVFVSGSFSGLKDISETMLYSSSASLRAAQVMKLPEKGMEPGRTGGNGTNQAAARDVSMEEPVTAAVLCKCPSDSPEKAGFVESFCTTHPLIDDFSSVDGLCTAEGWNLLLETIKEKEFNRVLIFACLPCLFKGKLAELSEFTGLSECYLDVVDVSEMQEDLIEFQINTAVSKIRQARVPATRAVSVSKRVLVIGGGIAGMNAALSCSQAGIETVLVEKESELGGNLSWLHSNIDGTDFTDILEATKKEVEKNPLISVMKDSFVADTSGETGNFITIVRSDDQGDGETGHTIRHGAAVIATGSNEADVEEYRIGEHDAIMTTREYEEKKENGELNQDDLKTVVMIQCVQSRNMDRQYCSRVCCSSSIKQALALKDADPDKEIYILYRDIMTYGFSETYYKQAREKGIIFIRYTPDRPPRLDIKDDKVSVTVYESILESDIEIKTDALILASGMKPAPANGVAEMFNIKQDDYGFILQGDVKWRPCDTTMDGIFVCGTAAGPRNVHESIASAQAAAQRALRIAGRDTLASSRITAQIKESLCSLCERCIDACPYSARMVDYDRRKIHINPALCQGCGSCAAVCPNSASYVSNLADQQFFNIIEAAV